MFSTSYGKLFQHDFFQILNSFIREFISCSKPASCSIACPTTSSEDIIVVWSLSKIFPMFLSDISVALRMVYIATCLAMATSLERFLPFISSGVVEYFFAISLIIFSTVTSGDSLPLKNPESCSFATSTVISSSVTNL